MTPSKMRAAFVVKPGRVEVRETDVPSPGPEEVLIRISFTGICGTDIAILNGIYSAEHLPLIPGHEFAGRVAALGSSVLGFSEGQAVTADINMGCGSCFYCRQNAVLMCPQVKQLGIHTHGAMAEYLVVPAQYVRALPESLDLAAASLLEPISCVVRAARMGGLTFGGSVAVLGAGPAGLLHLQMARICGVAPVIVIGKHQSRLDMARELGADHTILHGPDEAEELRGCTKGRGPDFLIESTGRIESYEASFRLVRPGGRILAFGLTEAGQTARFEPFQVVLQELSLTGSVAGMGEDVFQAVNLVSYGRFNLEPFTSVRLPLEKIAQGFEMVQNDKSVLKVLISME